MHRFRYGWRTLGVIIILPFVWYLFFGGEVFGPAEYRESEDQICRQYMSGCPLDEIRFQQYLNGVEAQRVAFSFTTKHLTSPPVLPIASYGLFWNRVEYVFHTENFPPLSFKEPEYDEKRLNEIHSALVLLPTPRPLNDLPFRQQFHVAFYRDGHLRIYSYPRDEARVAFSQLFQALEIPVDSLYLHE